MDKAFYSIWFTGLSGSGKSATADELAFAMKDAGIMVQRIDEQVLLNDILQKEFASRDDEAMMLRMASYITSLLINSGQIPIISMKLSKKELRSKVRESIPDSIIIYTKCIMEECEKRDPHSLYKMVREGVIRDIPGVDGVFEEPESAEIILNTCLDDTKSCTRAIIGYLDFNGYLTARGQCQESTIKGYTSEQESVVKKRLEDLGYL